MMKKIYALISLIIVGSIAILSLSACSTITTSSNGETLQKTGYAETVFEVVLAEPLIENEILYLEILDEVTGIALNPTRYEMEAKDNLSYFIRLPLAKNSVVKYRYVRQGTDANIIEHDSNGNQVQYRMDVIKKAEVVSDFIAGWNSDNYTGTVGEISGYIYDEDSDAPLSEIMVYINGQRTTTTSDGFYEVRNIPLGEYNLVAMHPDGKYQVFQQGAMIAENSVTPASFGMEAADLVEVTFLVTPPESETTVGDMRLISNLYSLGNTYAENDGGISVLSSQAPVLELQDNGKYAITLELPEGFDLQYKFSLGDGFINAEHDEDGSYKVRQLIVPGRDTTIKNIVRSWYSSGSSPVTFNLTVPQSTPENDEIAIQFNPFVWMESIPMQQVDQDHWTFTLYSPQEYLNNAQFRFCRNYQCGLADDSLTSGKNATGYVLDLSSSVGVIEYELEYWSGFYQNSYSLSPISIPSDNSIYIKAVELGKAFDKQAFATYEWGLVDAAVDGANMLIVKPSWTFPESLADQIRIQTGSDFLYSDLDEIESFATEAGLTTALFPQPRFTTDPESDYWYTADLSYNWWEDWFQKYERFILNYASYAELSGIQTLIIGGSQVSPAFPGGHLANGNASNTPYDFAEKWSGLVDDIRSRFSGQLFFALPYSSNLDNAPECISKADAVYVEFSNAITASNAPSLSDLKSSFSQLLDSEVYKLYARYQKPVILGINYPSVLGSSSDCLSYSESCVKFINSYSAALINVDLEEQAKIYQAIIEEAIQRNWIYGLVSQGFNPSVSVQDNSSSVYGKTAAAVMSYYFNLLVR